MKHPEPCLVCIVNKFESRLEHWQIDYYGNSYATRFEEGRVKVASGNVYNDPRFPDGKQIWTSTIEWHDEFHVRTRNTNYILGKKSSTQLLKERSKEDD